MRRKGRANSIMRSAPFRPIHGRWNVWRVRNWVISSRVKRASSSNLRSPTAWLVSSLKIGAGTARPSVLWELIPGGGALAPGSNRHDFFLFVSQVGVDLGNELIGQLLHFFLRVLQIFLGNAALLGFFL